MRTRCGIDCEDIQKAGCDCQEHSVPCDANSRWGRDRRNNSEKRRARTLLIMAEFGKPGEPESMIPPVTQQELANMIGTTRSRVGKFMNNFRNLHYIDYNGNGRIHIHKALLNVELHDRLPEQTARRPVVVDDELPAVRNRNRSKAA